MTPARGYIANTLTFSYGVAGTPNVWTVVARVQVMGQPDAKTATTDVSGFDSAGWKEKIANIKDGGSFSVNLIWINDITQDNVVGLKHLFDSNTGQPIMIKFAPGNATLTTKSDYMMAIPTGWQRDGKYDGFFGIKATFEVSGPVIESATDPFV